jgi:hypothetical protein
MNIGRAPSCLAFLRAVLKVFIRVEFSCDGKLCHLAPPKFKRYGRKFQRRLFPPLVLPKTTSLVTIVLSRVEGAPRTVELKILAQTTDFSRPQRHLYLEAILAMGGSI